MRKKNQAERRANDAARQRKTDEQFMLKALGEAMTALHAGELPIGAVAVCGGKIIARAYNLTETLHDVTAHAEMQVITSAENFLGGKYLTDCTLYVTLEPCAMCACAIGWAQIGRLVYGASDARRGYTHTAPAVLHPKCTVTAGVCDADCRRLLLDFFGDRR